MPTAVRAVVSTLVLAVLLVLVARTSDAAPLAGLSGTLTGTDAFKRTTATRTPKGKFKKKVVGHGKDAVAPTIAFDSASGAFTITGYEDFPVTGTWTATSKGAVTLTVDNDAFAAQKGAELCPAASCTPRATWTPRAARFDARKSALKVKWLITVRQTSADGSYVEETFKFHGAGALSP